MKKADWGRLRRYFEESQSLSAVERVALLERVRKEDPDLGAQLEALVAQDESDEVSLTGAISSAAAQLREDDADRRIGLRLGPWRIVSHIARGGMGDVFEAERADGEFEQRVAIKLIGAGALSPDAVARFRAERQILARLNHPNIAQIVDGGTADDGVTYLVMEYVDGLPVDSYCREHGLNVEDRLKLFRRICDVLEFAHRNLVVHRDIKPSNILINQDGEPKLLDFGIAKLLETDAPTEPAAPATTRIMTPDYASPEQILGLPITTSCDVYSLGVLLYELLTGRRPHQLRNKRPSELERAVCEVTPPKPSTVVSEDTGVGYARPSAVGRKLAGELDNIVMMALRVKPEDRYGSVQQLSADLRRFLDGQPVVARGRSWGYLAAKFLRRNRVPVAIATLAVLGITALVGFHIQQISAERDLVRLEAERTAAISDFLQSIFNVANPDENRGETITARDILDQGAARLETELADQPAIRSTLLTTVGTVYGFLGLYDDAIRILEEAVAYERSQGDPVALARSLELLGRNVYETGDLDRGLALLEEAQGILVANGLEEHPLATQTLYSLGQVHLFRGDFDESLEYHTASLALIEQLDSRDAIDISAAEGGIGQTLQMQGDVAAAEVHYRRSVAARRAMDGERPSITGLTYVHNLATILHELGKDDEAETLYLEVYREEPVVAGEDHPDRDAAMTNLGRFYQETGRPVEAEKFLREAVEHSARTRGERHRYTAYNMNNLASLLHRTGQVEASRRTYQDVLSIYGESLPAGHPYIASAKVGYAGLLNTVGDYGDAETEARAAIAICEEGLPDGHWLTARAHGVLGAALLGSGDLDTAESELLSSWENLKETRPGHPMTRDIVERLVDLYRRKGDSARAGEFEAILETFDTPAATSAVAG